MKTLIALTTRYVHAALVNYKTTLAGICMIVHALSILLSHALAVAEGKAMIDPDSLMLAQAEFMAGLGFISARDADRSSQDSGLRK